MQTRQTLLQEPCSTQEHSSPQKRFRLDTGVRHMLPCWPGCCPSANPPLASEAPAPQPNPQPQAQHLHDPFDCIDGCIQERAGPQLITAVICMPEAQEEDVGRQVWEHPRASLWFVVCRGKQDSWNPGSYRKLVPSQAGCCPSNTERMSLQKLAGNPSRDQAGVRSPHVSKPYL